MRKSCSHQKLKWLNDTSSPITASFSWDNANSLAKAVACIRTESQSELYDASAVLDAKHVAAKINNTCWSCISQDCPLANNVVEWVSWYCCLVFSSCNFRWGGTAWYEYTVYLWSMMMIQLKSLWWCGSSRQQVAARTTLQYRTYTWVRSVRSLSKSRFAVCRHLLPTTRIILTDYAAIPALRLTLFDIRISTEVA